MIYFKDSGTHSNFKELLSEGFGKEFYFSATYSDKECTIEECHPARRSFPALLEICQTYYPDTTKEELAFHLLQNYGYRGCDNISKIVFMRSTSVKTWSKNKVGVDGYSLKMIEDLAENYKNETGKTSN